MTKIAIIGAGLSGLSIAHLLKDYAQITVFEKARGVSGRLSTRRAEPYVFDHGAQYFTARTQVFQDFIQPFIKQGIIERWNARYVKFDDDEIVEQKNWVDDEPRYVGVPQMNKVAKYLAAGLNVHVNTRIVSLEHEKSWKLIDEKGHLYNDFDWVISAVPSPQAAELLPSAFAYHANICAIEMRACFSLMLGFSERLPLDFEAAHVTNSDLSWIAINSQKPGRVDQYTLMVHSSGDYAEAHIDDDREAVMQHLIAQTSRIIGHDVSTADYKTVHGWRYANNAKREISPVFLDQNLKLAACGDWCLGGRVEGAFTSSHRLFCAMRELAL
jgi:renalase